MSDTARKSWRQRPLPAARRFSDNAFVLDEPKLQFYLAAPLTPPVYVCRRCVVGQKARRFCAEQANMLAGMAELVVRAPHRPQPPRPASGVG